MWGYYRPQTKFAKVMFSQLSVCPQGGGLSLCLGSLRPRWGGLCPGDLCPGGSLLRVGALSRGFSVQGVSVRGDLSGRVSVGGAVCLGDSLSRGGSLSEGSLSRGVSVMETPRMVMSGWYASYWNAFCNPQFPFLFKFECELPNGNSAIHKSFELPFGHSHSFGCFQ